MSTPLSGELPLRIVDGPDGAMIRCLCGATGASVRRHVAHQMTGLRAAPAATVLSPDVTPAGLARMVLHGQTCERGKQLLAQTGAAA
jgi:hypothetical protein